MKIMSARKLSLGLVVASFVLLAASCNTAKPTSNQTDTNSPTKIKMTSADQFSPQTTTVAAGTVIEWNNADTDPHAPVADTATWLKAGLTSDTQFPNGVAAGSSWSWTVPATTKSGTKIYYHCRFHGGAGNGQAMGTGMAGVIVVK
jgi:plastocyanin